ncbi:hypothetical protein Aperf_G00000024621 [Anoplocephala perfoliata]
MPAPLVFMVLIITGVRTTALNNTTQQPPLDNDGDIFVDTFVDYLLSLLRSFIPDAITLDKSPGHVVSIRNATVYGLRHIERGGPTVLNGHSTPDNDYINCVLSLDLKNYLKVEGLFQITTYLYDSGFSPATLQLFDFIVGVNLTLTLPRIYENTSEALLQFDGVPKVDISRLQFTTSEDEEGSMFSILGYMTSLLSSGPLGEYLESKIGHGVSLAIKRLNNKMQETVGKFVDKYT